MQLQLFSFYHSDVCESLHIGLKMFLKSGRKIEFTMALHPYSD